MCPVKRDLAISNLKKYTVKGTNHHQFLLAIPTVLTYTFERTYLYQSSPSSESLSPFSHWIPTSVAILSHWILHMSVHFRPAFKQQQFSKVHALLHVQESSSKTSSGAGLDPRHTNFTTLEMLSTSQPCPWGEGITGHEMMALLQIAAW